MSEWAIDFETANPERAACSVGVVEVASGALGRQEYHLIRPNPFTFNEWNTRVHGIRPQDVERAPGFAEVWQKIGVEPRLFLAHNAGFDADVLRLGLARAGIALPSVSFVCTMQLARVAFPGLHSYSLSMVAAHLGVPLDHHHALNDAIACARIGIAAAAVAGANSVWEAASVFGVPIRPLVGAWHEPDRVTLPTGIRAERADLPVPTNRIDGLSIAITGQLLICTREEAIQLITDAGGTFHRSVRKDTDFLVVGIEPGAKVQTAEARKAKYGKPNMTTERGFRILLGL